MGVRRSLKPRKGRRKSLLTALRILALFAGVALLTILFVNQLHPLVKSFGDTQARWEATRAINEAVTAVLADAQLQYEDLVTVGKDEEGNLAAVEANVVKINQLKAAITTAVLEKLEETSHLSMSIPLGTLIGGDLLNGWGPRIHLRVTVSGSVVTTLHSQFISAGINQTSHQITMDLQSKIALSIPGYMTTVTVDSSFLIAETVLVGKVPDSYTEVDGTQADLLGKIFAFGGDSA